MAVVVAIVVIAGGIGGYLVFNHRGQSGEVVVDDGPTVSQALASANSSLASISGGPWTLSQVFGIASPVPTNPGVWGWGEYDRTYASCQAAFNGVTIWNGTIPTFHGTFNSGTAPFWQFVYFSNTSQQLLVATVVEGVAHAYPPIALSSPCGVYSGLAYDPWASFAATPYPSDSPGMARSAWDTVAKSYVTRLNRTPTEMYLFGGLQFGSGQPVATETKFFTCGTPDAAGVPSGLDVFVNPGNPRIVTGWGNYSIGCTPTTNNFTAIPLAMNFSTPATTSVGGTTDILQSFRFLMMGSPPFAGPGYNLRGITSSMIVLNLTDGTGHALPMGQPSCRGWAPSLSDCVANASGWFAVLLSPSGAWIGSYGAFPSGAGWDNPVVPIVNNETVAVVVPSSWNVTGDHLQVTSIAAQLPLTGSTMLA